MEKNKQRIGVGNNKYPSIGESFTDPQPGYFTFDSTTVTFDSMVDTFDFDVIAIVPVIIRDFIIADFLEIDFK